MAAHHEKMLAYGLLLLSQLKNGSELETLLEHGMQGHEASVEREQPLLRPDSKWMQG